MSFILQHPTNRRAISEVGSYYDLHPKECSESYGKYISLTSHTPTNVTYNHIYISLKLFSKNVLLSDSVSSRQAFDSKACLE